LIHTQSERERYIYIFIHLYMQPVYTMAQTDAKTEQTARASHIFTRLLDLHNYVWDTEAEPFHSVSGRTFSFTSAKLTRTQVLR
jgi:hypothetical protein